VQGIVTRSKVDPKTRNKEQETPLHLAEVLARAI